MKRAFLSISLFTLGMAAASGQTLPQTMTLPKDWSSSKPGYAPSTPSGNPWMPGHSGQTTLNLAGSNLIAKQTEAITELDERVKKLEAKIQALEAQVAEQQK
jgi:peptidoglycan hydrolase CwlO-like protein